MNTDQSARLFAQAKTLIPGGVNSPVRACRSVGCDPLFVRRAEGCLITDVDGNEFIDFVGSWGPMILGHAHSQVVAAIRRTAGEGTSFGAPSPLEVELAEMVCRAVPSMDKVRFVSSGTEATMSAVRLARGCTGRKVVVKFDGCYHGHADTFLVRAGSGVITLGIPGSPGVPEDIVKNTLSIPYNDPQTLERTLRDGRLDIACVIVEPVAGNMGVVPPAEGFLQTLRQLTRELGIVLIFDEVITGFRLALGGAQERFGITPDLTCLGKIIGGGLPVGAYGGRGDLMDQIAPDGPVYQAGTLSGNPLAVAAGLATLTLIQAPDFHADLARKTTALCQGLTAAAQAQGIVFSAQSVGGMFGVYFRATCPQSYAEVMECDKDAFNRFFHALLEMGHYFAPSAYEAGFVSAAHSDDDIAATVAAAAKAFRR